jgi:hypothetical protein
MNSSAILRLLPDQTYQFRWFQVHIFKFTEIYVEHYVIKNIQDVYNLSKIVYLNYCFL